MVITHDKGGTMFTGESVNVFMIAALRSGLGLMAVGIKPHRSWTSLRAALEQATRYTGKAYKGKKDIERARADLEALLP
jgi:hypothetical protein